VDTVRFREMGIFPNSSVPYGYLDITRIAVSIISAGDSVISEEAQAIPKPGPEGKSLRTVSYPRVIAPKHLTLIVSA
jgi:hypothetical protein